MAAADAASASQTPGPLVVLLMVVVAVVGIIGLHMGGHHVTVRIGHDQSLESLRLERTPSGKWKKKYWPYLQCPGESATLFYKTHKTGSTSLTNMLYR